MSFDKSSLISAVAGLTSVDSSLLLDDEGFCKILNRYCGNHVGFDSNWATAIEYLTSYVQDNY